MAKGIKCKVYFTNFASTTLPDEIPSELVFIEERWLFLPKYTGTLREGQAITVINRLGIQTSSFPIFEEAVPQWELLSTYYNINTEPLDNFFLWFPNYHNYYPNYVTNNILHELLNTDGTTYGYILSMGGSWINSIYAIYDSSGKKKILESTNFIGGSTAPIVEELDGKIVDTGTMNIVDNSGSIRVQYFGNESFPSGNKELLLQFLNNAPFLEPSNDPYEPGGGSTSGGGTGTFDGTSDEIDFPPLPSLSAVDTGFITLFNPSMSEMKNLADYMWSDLFDIATWKKLFANPMDAILGLSIVPVAVPDAGQKIVTVGNVSTGISMNVAQSQFVEVDCGTLNINEYWGAYLDYSPYTEAELYLPYIGIHAIKTDDIMGKSVHIKYHIDILSGACCAYVKCGNSVLYEFVGQGSCSIPITGNDWTNVINGALTIGASIGTMMATGGASAPMISSAASAAVNSLKPTVERSGSVSGMGGMLGIQKPYLVLTRPRQALPSKQNTYMGYPSFITSKLGDLSGYTEVEAVHLENIPATKSEIAEIESLLKDGVIF